MNIWTFNINYYYYLNVYKIIFDASNTSLFSCIFELNLLEKDGYYDHIHTMFMNHSYYYWQRGNISLIFSRNFEAYASKCQENPHVHA